MSRAFLASAAIGFILPVFIATVAVFETANDRLGDDYVPYAEYYLTSDDGKIVKTMPLEEANMTRAALMSWVSRAVTDSLTFNPALFESRTQKSAAHFTGDGWGDYTQWRDVSAYKDAFCDATPRTAPRLLSEGVENEKYIWRIILPMLLTCGRGGKDVTNTLVVKLDVERVPWLEASNGVGIRAWEVTGETGQ